MRYISIDIETSGLDPNRHSVLSIGAYERCSNCIEHNFSFYRKLLHPELVVQAEAIKLNKLDLTTGDEAREVCCRFLDWLPKEPWIGLGWNYPQFDLPFLNKLLKDNNFKDLGYRGIDLNSLCYFTGADKKALKTDAKQRFIMEHGLAFMEHSALDDAVTSYYCFEALRKRLRNSLDMVPQPNT